MTKYNDETVYAIYYCDKCNACNSSWGGGSRPQARDCPKCPETQRAILITNDVKIWQEKEREIVEERKVEKTYKEGYEAGLSARFTADFKQGILEYLKMNPLSLVDYTQLTLEAGKSTTGWQKASFYVKIQ